MLHCKHEATDPNLVVFAITHLTIFWKVALNLKQESVFIFNDFVLIITTIAYIVWHCMTDVWLQQNLPIFFKKMKKDILYKPLCYINYQSRKLIHIYQFCENVWRQDAFIIQLWSNFFANRTIYGVKDSWRLLIMTSKGNDCQNLLLVKWG